MTTPKYGHDPIPMRRRGADFGGKFLQRGDFYWHRDPSTNHRTLVLAVPHKNKLGYLYTEWSIDHKNESGAQWSWNGDEDKPTLTPSLHAIGVWHGKVTDGMMVEAE